MSDVNIQADFGQFELQIYSQNHYIKVILQINYVLRNFECQAEKRFIMGDWRVYVYVGFVLLRGLLWFSDKRRSGIIGWAGVFAVVFIRT